MLDLPKQAPAAAVAVLVPEVPKEAPPPKLDMRSYPVRDTLQRSLPMPILEALDRALLGRLDVYAHVVDSSVVHAFAEDDRLSALVIDTPRTRLTAFLLSDAKGQTRWFDAEGKRVDTGAFLGRPLELSRITSPYGTRLHPITGDVRSHRGVDYGAAPGTPIYAVADGTVATKATDAASGNYLKLGHAGRQSLYLHLDAFGPGIEQNAAVKQGQVIGFVGTTGMSTGPHLHFEMRMGPVSLDPLQTLPVPLEVLTSAERSVFLPRVQRIMQAAPPISRP